MMFGRPKVTSASALCAEGLVLVTMSLFLLMLRSDIVTNKQFRHLKLNDITFNNLSDIAFNNAFDDGVDLSKMSLSPLRSDIKVTFEVAMIDSERSILPNCNRVFVIMFLEREPIAKSKMHPVSRRAKRSRVVDQFWKLSS